jgi:hypothetical protein
LLYAPSSSLLQGKYLLFSPSPLRLNIFRLFVILSQTQLYRYTPEIFLFSTATFKYTHHIFFWMKQVPVPRSVKLVAFTNIKGSYSILKLAINFLTTISCIW